MLRRILAYGRKVLGWEARLDAVRDDRRQPRIPTAAVVRAAVGMILARLGSLNALEQTRSGGFWGRWLGGPLPSPDTMGRVCGRIDVGTVRAVLRGQYARLQRMKALSPPAHGLMIGVLDGHESCATFRRCCPGCLARTVHTARGDRVQYYHRYVALRLVGGGLELMLDLEAQRPGEAEVATAMRLLERVLKDYPRALDVVAGDGLYAQAPLFAFVLAHGKHALAVLKDEQRDLLQDARALFDTVPPVEQTRGCLRRHVWDAEGFLTWPQVGQPVRVVRSLERRTVRRQLDGRTEELVADWFWVTTLPVRWAPAGAVIAMGHDRWKIENEGFNDLVNGWHADHVYRHHPTAMLVLWLLTIACVNGFLTFYRRNLKPAARAAATMLHVARQITAELYVALPGACPRGPP